MKKVKYLQLGEAKIGMIINEPILSPNSKNLIVISVSEIRETKNQRLYQVITAEAKDGEIKELYITENSLIYI